VDSGAAGARHPIVGPNGAGKTTLINPVRWRDRSDLRTGADALLVRPKCVKIGAKHRNGTPNF
jgi:ABC-type molybdenum transport system ATPase subunit/photorepair protein PhrA